VTAKPDGFLLRYFVERKYFVATRRENSLYPATVIPEAAIAKIRVGDVKLDLAQGRSQTAIIVPCSRNQDCTVNFASPVRIDE
jgi:hypothetical protein